MKEVNRVNGVMIYLNTESGQFEARIGNRTVRRKDMGYIERELHNLGGPAVPVWDINASHVPAAIHEREVIAYRNERWLYANGGESGRWENFWTPNEKLRPQMDALISQANDLREQLRTLENQWYALMQELKAFRPEDLEKARAAWAKEQEAAGPEEGADAEPS